MAFCREQRPYEELTQAAGGQLEPCNRSLPRGLPWGGLLSLFAIELQ